MCPVVKRTLSLNKENRLFPHRFVSSQISSDFKRIGSALATRRQSMDHGINLCHQTSLETPQENAFQGAWEGCSCTFVSSVPASIPQAWQATVRTSSNLHLVTKTCDLVIHIPNCKYNRCRFALCGPTRQTVASPIAVSRTVIRSLIHPSCDSRMWSFASTASALAKPQHALCTCDETVTRSVQ